MLQKKEIKERKWVNSKTQLANSLTERGASSDLLINVLSTGKLSLKLGSILILSTSEG